MVRVSKLTKEAREGKFMKFVYEDTRTLYDVFRRGVRESSEYSLYCVYYYTVFIYWFRVL